MSPQRFPHLEDAAAREVAEQVDRIWLRTMLISITLLICVTIATAIGLYVYATGITKADLTAAQTHDLRDARRLALNNCHRSQDTRRALATLVTIAIPRQDPHRTPTEERQIISFYQRLTREHVLQIPTCTL